MNDFSNVACIQNLRPFIKVCEESVRRGLQRGFNKAMAAAGNGGSEGEEGIVFTGGARLLYRDGRGVNGGAAAAGGVADAAAAADAAADDDFPRAASL